MKPPPKELKGFPGSVRTKPKTPFPGGLRRRWKLAGGGFADWDYQHGEIEIYNDQGKHKRAFDPATGTQIKPRDPTRTAPK
ncbi:MULTISPECIES: colicin E3/pyocin S6 family cytotoxin [unclassified Bradyrhizobium]